MRVLSGCIGKTQKARPQRGQPTGTLDSEIRIAMLLLGQRPLRYAGVGRSYSIAERTLVCIKHTARPRQTKIQNREMVLKHGGAPLAAASLPTC